MQTARSPPTTASPKMGVESAARLLDIHTMAVTILVCSSYTFALVASAFDEMAVELEDAATMPGAGTWRKMPSITTPLVSPAFPMGFILSFIQGMTLFGVPAFLLPPSSTRAATAHLAACG